jgi:hypothetical protein
MVDSESDEKESSFYTRKDRLATKRKDDVEMVDSESGSKTSSVDSKTSWVELSDDEKSGTSNNG